MTKRLSDRQAEVTRLYVEMEHHRATLTAAQDAAEHAAVVCKNNFDTLTHAIQNERAGADRGAGGREAPPVLARVRVLDLGADRGGCRFVPSRG